MRGVVVLSYIHPMDRSYSIAGTHCRSCQILLEQKLKEIPGITHAHVDWRTGRTWIRADQGTHAIDASVADVVRAAGYRLGVGRRPPFISRSIIDWQEAIAAACIVVILYFIYIAIGLDRFSDGLATTASAGSGLVVGLVAGVSTCMALIGSLVLGLSARHAQHHPHATPWQRIRPNLAFNGGRVLGFALLGGLIGVVGSVFRLQGAPLGFLVIAAGALMVIVGAKLTGLLPRLESLTLPTSLARLVGFHPTVEGYSHRVAMTTGALTFFLPCAFTQTMQVLAISTGDFVQGAMVMGAFALGTTPGLIGIGGVAGFASGAFGRMFMKIAGVAVLLLGIWNMGNGWNLTGITLGNLTSAAIGTEKGQVAVAEVRDGKQYVVTEQIATGYKPSRVRVQAGIPVIWTIISRNSYSCASSISIPSLRISRRLQEGENVIEFTPAKPGIIKFSCSMGMFTGSIEVVQ